MNYPTKRPFGSHFSPTKVNLIPLDLFSDNFRDIWSDFVDDIFGNAQKSKDLLKSKGDFPKADVVVTKDNFIRFRLAIPGMTRDQIQVEFDEETGDLAITGEDTSAGTDENVTNVLLNQLRHSKFMRSWKLDKNLIDKKREITSSLADGILEVAIPLVLKEKEVEEKKKKMIEIN